MDLDPTLAVLSSGAVAPKAATVEIEFSGGGSGQPLVRMVRAGKELKISWPKELPKPVVDGSTAEYRSILPDVDLRLTATKTGFAQLVVVHTAEAAKNPELDQLRLGLETTDLTVRQEGDGSLTAVDISGGGTVFEAPPPVMWDSSTAAAATPAGLSARTQAAPSGTAGASPTVGDIPGDGARVAPLKVDLAENEMRLTPDQVLLEDPSTVFPVMIDPAWDAPHAADWAGVSRYYPNQTYWHFTYTPDDVHDWGVGYCGDSTRCKLGDVKRAFFQVPSGMFIGKQILRATFGTYESHTYDCAQPRPVELWNTGYISPGLTWNAQNASGFWSRKLQTVTTAKGNSGCDAGWIEWGGDDAGVKNLVQDAANWGWQTTTFGLKAQNESDLNGWKRFTDGAYLQVQYNLRPNQIPNIDMSMSPGSECRPQPVRINKVPQVTVRATDPDGEAIGVQFAASWDAGDGMRRRWWSTGSEGTAPGSNAFKGSGSIFSWTLPADLPQGTQLSWEARAWDGASWGDWSSEGDPTACYFTLDTTAPQGPVITSPTYPGSSDATAELPWTDGVGRYGSFTLKSASTDVVKYQWGLDSSTTATGSVSTTGGAAQTIKALPETPGLHRIWAQAIDASNNASQPETFYFNVLAGQGQRAGWNMDGSLNGSGAEVPAVLGSGATAGSAGRVNNGMAFNGDAGTGYAQTEAAVLDTSRSFSVSSWVMFNGATTSRVAVSQNGPNYYAFTLGTYVVGTDNRWAFKVQSAPGDSDSTTFVVSANTAQTGQWTHLTGVYDSAAHSILLYVNGVLAGSTLVPSALWDGHGPVQFGRDRWQGQWAAAWPGSVDEIKLWDRALTGIQVTQVAADQTATGTPAKAVWHLDESATATVKGAPEADALKPTGSVQTGVTGVAGQAIRLDGTTGYLRTARPQVDGARDFSVAAWVKLPKPAAGDTTAKVAISQIGQHNSEFALYYSAAAGRWTFGRYKEDTAADTQMRVAQPDCTTGTLINGVPCLTGTTEDWTHLLGVNDTTAKKLRFYINGYLVAESAYTQTSPWANPGPLQIGSANREGVNTEFFRGDIDDVRLYDRIVTKPEAAAMVQQRPRLAGRWKLSAAAGTPAVTPGEVPANGGTSPNIGATLNGGASINASGGLLPKPGTLLLNGTTAYAATNTALVHTNQSFTLAAWANTAGTPTRDMTVLSLPGANNSAVTLRWHYLGLDANGQPSGEWQAEVRDSDAGGASRTLVARAPGYSLLENWTHLAVSYDALAGRIALYVNGTTGNVYCPGGATGCTARTAVTGAPAPFDASGGLQFGRSRSGGAWGEYFSGELDDVWLYQGVLSGDQIAHLANYNYEASTDPGV
ncbi:LamG-like jellyroll fold domain-containing protein [Kitasatospora griseola]